MKTHGFTLLEILVVVVIIAILSSIGLTVGNSLVRANESRRTMTILANCNQIETEFNVLLGRTVNHMGRALVDWADPIATKNTNAPKGSIVPSVAMQRSTLTTNQRERQQELQAKSISRFVWATERVSSLSKLYATFHDNTLRDVDEDGFLDVLDAWGRKIMYVAAVRYDVPGGPTPLPLPPQLGEIVYGGNEHDSDDFLPLSDNPYFISAGPDGKWGHVSANVPAFDVTPFMDTVDGGSQAKARARLAEEASDNLYSTEVLR